MRSTGPLAAVAAITLAVTLAGCSSSGSGELTYDDSPLNEYLSAAYGGDMSPEEQQKQFDEQQRKQEDLMAQCMADEGFEYQPNVQSGQFIVSDEEETPWKPDDKEWVEKYGYGMVNSPYNEQMPTDQGEEYVDPNQDYVNSLSESEQAAYWETAYGAGPSEEELNEDGSYEYRWEDAGCQGWAQHELGGDDPWQSDEFADLRAKMDEFWTAGQDAPEYKELNAEWAACMDEGGQPGFTVQSEPAQSISDEQNEIYNAAYGDGSVEIDPETFVDPATSPEMKALGEKEIALALVDLACREKTSYTQESLKIQFAREEQFIADNKAALEAFKAAAEQKK